MLVKRILIVSITALSIFAQDHSAMDHSKMDHSKMEKTGRITLSEVDKNLVVKALEANESLHSSFFDYKGVEVEENAKALKNAISNINDKEVLKLLTFSIKKLGEIKASNSREINDENYHLVSMALIHIINKYDVGSKYNAYSCPMVKKKWIQNSSKLAGISNPYAPDMKDCGSKDSSY